MGSEESVFTRCSRAAGDPTGVAALDDPGEGATIPSMGVVGRAATNTQHRPNERRATSALERRDGATFVAPVDIARGDGIVRPDGRLPLTDRTRRRGESDGRVAAM